MFVCLPAAVLNSSLLNYSMGEEAAEAAGEDFLLFGALRRMLKPFSTEEEKKEY